MGGASRRSEFISKPHHVRAPGRHYRATIPATVVAIGLTVLLTQPHGIEPVSLLSRGKERKWLGRPGSAGERPGSCVPLVKIEPTIGAHSQRLTEGARDGQLMRGVGVSAPASRVGWHARGRGFPGGPKWKSVAHLRFYSFSFVFLS